MVHANSLKKAVNNFKPVLVSKKDYPKLKDALAHLKDLGHNLHYIDKKVEETPNYFKFNPKPSTSKVFEYRAQA
jgi:hypothetical protein